MADVKDKFDARYRIVNKALKDEGFKKELMANPNAAIAKELGITIPAGICIKVVEDTQTEVHLVLPAMIGGGGAISDSDLEKVSGGGGCGGVSGNFGGEVTKPPMIQCSNCTNPPLKAC